ncbi:MAG: serine hydrolase domain-containing protein [Promethearchaeota archaeon]
MARGMVTTGVDVGDLLARLDGFLAAEVEEGHLPGLGVGVVYKGEVVYQEGFGNADLEGGVPVTPDTVFRVASISKTLTAVAVMQQYELGKFGLDDDVNQYLPEGYGRVGYNDPSAPPVTFRRLMTHTSGIGELKGYTSVLHPRTLFEFCNPKRAPLLPLERLYRKGIKTNVPPGAKYAYANHGIAFLGHLLEVLSGEPYHEYLRRHVLAPAGMERTDAYQSDRVRPHFARGYKYDKRRGRFKRTRFLRSWIRPAGGVYSSLGDMTEYARVLLSGTRIPGGRLLRPETLELMWQPHFYRDERLGKIGLTFFLKDLDGHRLVHHGGLDIGFASMLALLPEDDLGFVVLCNRAATGSVYKISRFIAFTALGMGFPGTPTGPDHPLPAGELGKFTGTYGPPPGFLSNIRVYMGPWEFRVGARDDHLVLKSLRGAKRRGSRLWRVDPGDPDLFEVRDNLETKVLEPAERLVFRRDESGAVVGFYKGLMEFVRRDGVRSLKFKLVLLALLASAVLALAAALLLIAAI